jgi:hypothetical protein
MALGAVFLLLSGLVWPISLGRVMPLEWRAGNLRPVAFALQALFLLAGVACVLARDGLNRRIEATRRDPGRLAVRLAAVPLSMGVGLVVAEIGMRILGLPFREARVTSEMALAQFDPELGWSYLPNRTVLQRFGSEQREVVMHFNERGSRVREPGVRFDAEAPTALFVGCSITMGHGVSYEESMEGQLEAMPGFPLQVVNLGVQAYGTDQALLMLRREMKKFNTRVVVYTYLDLHVERNENDDRRLIIPSARFLGTKPLFDLARDGTLYLSRKPERFAAMTDLRVRAALRLFYSRWGPPPRVELTRALIRDMKQFVESNGAKLLVVRWVRRPGARDAVLDGLNVHVLDTADSLPPGWSEWWIPGDGHPDGRAHGHVARLVAAELERLGWLQPGPSSARDVSGQRVDEWM